MANKSAILSVKIVGDSKNLQGALRRASKSVNDEMNKVSAASKRIGAAASSLFGLGSSFAKVGVLSAALLTATANVTTLAGSLLSVAGILPVLPGLFAGFAVGAAVTVMALKDAKTVLADLGPAFQGLQKSVSAKFWEKAADPIRSLTKSVLPALQSGMDRTATAIGGFFAETANSLKKSLTPSVMSSLFKPLIASIDIAKRAIDPLVQAFVTLGQIGGDYLPKLADGFVLISEKFNAFIQDAAASGQLQTWIDNGISALKNLGDIIGSTGRILGSLFKAASGEGATLSTLSDGLKKVADIVSAPGFQNALGTVFKGAGKAMDGLFKGLKPVAGLFERFAPIIAIVLETAGKLAGDALESLATVLAKNQPLIEQVATAIQNFGTFLGDVFKFISENAELFSALAIGFGLLIGVIKIMTTVFGILNIVMALNPITLIVAAVIILIGVIIYLATQTTFFQDVWKAVTDFCKAAWETFTKFVSDVWNGFVGFLQDSVNNIGKWFGDVLDGIGRFFSDIFGGIGRFVDGIVKGIRDAWDAAFNFVRSLVSSVINGVSTTINNVSRVVSDVTGFIGRAFSGAFNFISGVASSVINGIAGFFGRISTAVQNAMTWVRNLFNMGGMPGWLSSVLGMGGTGFAFAGSFDMVGGEGLGTGGTGFAFPAFSTNSGARNETTIINNSFVINGALDEVAVARKIKQIVNSDAIRNGSISAGGSIW